ncbi:MAG: hypothetical protein Tsb0021_15760 [Chlamydiales bacterium]
MLPLPPNSDSKHEIFNQEKKIIDSKLPLPQPLPTETTPLLRRRFSRLDSSRLGKWNPLGLFSYFFRKEIHITTKDIVALFETDREKFKQSARGHFHRLISEDGFQNNDADKALFLFHAFHEHCITESELRENLNTIHISQEAINEMIPKIEYSSDTFHPIFLDWLKNNLSGEASQVPAGALSDSFLKWLVLEKEPSYHSLSHFQEAVTKSKDIEINIESLYVDLTDRTLSASKRNTLKKQLFKTLNKDLLPLLSYQKGKAFRSLKEIETLIEKDHIDDALSLLAIQIETYEIQRETLRSQLNITLTQAGQLIQNVETKKNLEFYSKRKAKKHPSYLHLDDSTLKIEYLKKEKLALLKNNYTHSPTLILKEKHVPNPNDEGTSKRYISSVDYNTGEGIAYFTIKSNPFASNEIDKKYEQQTKLTNELSGYKKIKEKGIPHIAHTLFHTKNFNESELIMAMENYPNMSLDYFSTLSPEKRKAELPLVALHCAENLVQANKKDENNKNLLFLDIKPQNIVLKLKENSDKEITTIKEALFTDFGTVQLVKENITQLKPAGEQLYWPPEVILARLENRLVHHNSKIDVYSLGQTLASLRYGKELFSHEDYQDLTLLYNAKNFEHKLKQKYEDTSGVSEENWDKTDRFILRMMHRDPVQRPTPEEVKDFFQNLVTKS